MHRTIKQLIAAMILCAALHAPGMAQTETVTIPFDLNPCGSPIVTASWGGKEYVLLVDTGATLTTLRLRHKRKFKGDEATIVLAGGYTIKEKPAFAKLPPIPEICGKLDGVVGNNTLTKGHLLVFDFPHRTVIITHGNLSHAER